MLITAKNADRLPIAFCDLIPLCGNPINFGTGTKIEREMDVAPPDPESLRFERIHDSYQANVTTWSNRWASPGGVCVLGHEPTLEWDRLVNLLIRKMRICVEHVNARAL